MYVVVVIVVVLIVRQIILVTVGRHDESRSTCIGKSLWNIRIGRVCADVRLVHLQKKSGP